MRVTKALTPCPSPNGRGEFLKIFDSPAVMHVPLNDLKRQYLAMADELDAAARAVMAGGWYVMGREHNAFETEFAAYCGRRHAVAVGNGTDALEIALRAAGCQEGDEVLMVANAGGYAAAACLLVGAVPVFADIDAETLTLSPDSLAEAVGPRVKAAVITHLYGKLADMAGVRAALAGRDIVIIEDCAQAHGAMRDGRRAGAFGDLATFSFYPTKNLGAIGDGGAIVTDSDELAQKARLLRQYGWTEKYRAEMPFGRNSRLDELQAAVLRRKLPRLDAWNQRRREIVARYRDAAGNGALTIVHRPGPDYVAHLCVARHPDRQHVIRHFQQHGVETAIHYPIPDHLQPALDRRPWRAVPLPNTEAAVNEIFTLPSFAELTDDEVEHVSTAIRSLS
jgi:aminotransferase EvaB